MKLDDQYPFHGAHGRLTYDLLDKKEHHTMELVIPSTAWLTHKKKQRIPKVNVFQ